MAKIALSSQCFGKAGLCLIKTLKHFDFGKATATDGNKGVWNAENTLGYASTVYDIV